MTKQRPIPSVRPGQVWADNDSRSRGRTVRVVSVDDDGKATVRSGGKLTRIRLDRFRPTSTGYRLVEDVEEA